MNIRRVTRDYEAWLRQKTPVVERDLRHKHREMGASPFAFLRATYYRWAQLWPQECSDLAAAPVVTSVGDLHIENFGTWRDAEGRLAWGINDFDEAFPLPYTNDLVRLATSASLALKDDRLGLPPKEVFRALFDGYTATLDAGGRPVVLAERHRKLGERILDRLIDPKRFWREKLGSSLRPAPRPHASCRATLVAALPTGATSVVVRARIAGLGGLGLARFVAIAKWAGSRVAREVKARVPSAAVWATGTPLPDPPGSHVAQLLADAIRSRDPFLQVSEEWVVRRLAPDVGKIRLTKLGDLGLELQLLELMGSETANVHLATQGAARRILRDLGRRDSGWLRKAAQTMVGCVEEDHAAWKAQAAPS